MAAQPAEFLDSAGAGAGAGAASADEYVAAAADSVD